MSHLGGAASLAVVPTARDCSLAPLVRCPRRLLGRAQQLRRETGRSVSSSSRANLLPALRRDGRPAPVAVVGQRQQQKVYLAKRSVQDNIIPKKNHSKWLIANSNNSTDNSSDRSLPLRALSVGRSERHYCHRSKQTAAKCSPSRASGPSQTNKQH